MTSIDEVRKKAIAEATVGPTTIPHRGTPGEKTDGRPQRKAGFYLVDGVSYPSVTTILKVLDKPALLKWAAKMAAKAVLENPELYDTPEAAAASIYEGKNGQTATERGTEAHKVAEAYEKAIVKGTQTEFTSDNPYFLAIKAFFDQMRPEIALVEVVLVNTREGYAGTADLVAKVGGRMFIIDHKTSRYVFDEFPLQVEAYRHCDLVILEDGTRLTDQSGMSDGGAVVLLRDNGTFVWQEVKGDFEAFLACKRIFEWKQSLNGD